MKLRLLSDLTGEDVILNTDRPAGELLRDAMRIKRRVHHEQTLFRLCIHKTATTLTFHWYTNNDEFATDLRQCALTVEREMFNLLKNNVTV